MVKDDTQTISLLLQRRESKIETKQQFFDPTKPKLSPWFIEMKPNNIEKKPNNLIPQF